MCWLRNSKGHTTIVRSLLTDLRHVKWEQYTVQVTQECILEFTVSLGCSLNIHSVIPNVPQDTQMVCQQLHYGMSWFFFITKRYFAFDGFQCLGSSFFSLSVWRNKFANSVVVESCYHFKFRPMIFSHMLFFFIFPMLFSRSFVYQNFGNLSASDLLVLRKKKTSHIKLWGFCHKALD